MAEQSTFENELPKKSTVEYVRGLDANGNPILINKSDLASVVGELARNIIFGRFGIKSNIDANTLTETGIYHLTTGITNANEWAFLISFKSDSDHCVQIEAQVDNNTLRIRTKASNTWRNWKSISIF